MTASSRRILLAICILSLLCGPLLAAQAQGAEGQKEFKRWKFATLAPKEFGYSKFAQEVLYPRLEAATDGVVKVKVYWGGVMGDDEEYIKKIHIGQLQGAALSSQGTIQACPEFSVVELPFLFKNYAEVDYIRKKMFSTFEFLFKQYGFKLGSWIDQDFDQIFSKNIPIATLEDFAKAKFGTAHGRMEDLMLKDLGTTTVHLEVPEAPTAVRSGVVNAGIAPTLFVVGAQLYTSYKYVTDIKIRYSPAVTIISWKAWSDLPAKYQKALNAENEEGTRMINNMAHASNEKFMKAVLEYGMKSVQVTPDNLAKIKKKAMMVYTQLAGDVYPPELLQEISQYLAEYRSGKAGVVKVSAPEPEDEAVAALQKPDQGETAPAKGKRAWWEERKRQIMEVQKKLAPLGYYTTKIDGITGPNTKKGIEAYQKAKGLEVTGEINQELLDSMGVK